MRRALRAFVADESGADAIEYGMLCALIFLVIVGAVGLVATRATNLFFVIAASM